MTVLAATPGSGSTGPPPCAGSDIGNRSTADPATSAKALDRRDAGGGVLRQRRRHAACADRRLIWRRLPLGGAQDGPLTGGPSNGCRFRLAPSAAAARPDRPDRPDRSTRPKWRWWRKRQWRPWAERRYRPREPRRHCRRFPGNLQRAQTFARKSQNCCQFWQYLRFWGCLHWCGS